MARMLFVMSYDADEEYLEQEYGPYPQLPDTNTCILPIQPITDQDMFVIEVTIPDRDYTVEGRVVPMQSIQFKPPVPTRRQPANRR